MKIRIFSIFFSFSVLPPFSTVGQLNKMLSDAETDIYCIGVNPIALFTSIRTNFTSSYLPFLANQETGFSFSIGKIWNNNYNVETRASFDSPKKDYFLLQVQSGLNYCFSTGRRNFQPYAGVFFKIHSLQNQITKTDQISAISSLSIGNRIMFKWHFFDFRVNQNIVAVSWYNQPGTKAKMSFHPSIYKGASPHIPYA